MAKIVGKRFNREDVVVDGNEYEDCVFFECQIIYMGSRRISFSGCTFTNCNWVFDRAAENTLIYLSALYRGLGVPGKELVEGIFESIRRGTVDEGFLLPPQALVR